LAEVEAERPVAELRFARDQVFHHVIETAAVDLPLVALDAGGQPGARLQAEIEVTEMTKKRSTPAAPTTMPGTGLGMLAFALAVATQT
jgi:hypothetical protein